MANYRFLKTWHMGATIVKANHRLLYVMAMLLPSALVWSHDIGHDHEHVEGGWNTDAGFVSDVDIEARLESPDRCRRILRILLVCPEVWPSSLEDADEVGERPQLEERWLLPEEMLPGMGTMEDIRP